MVTHMQAPPALLWIDLETTGLNPSTGRILEVCAVLDTPAATMPKPLLLRGDYGKYVCGREVRLQVQVIDKVILQPAKVEALPWESQAFEMHRQSGLVEELAVTEAMKSERHAELWSVERTLVEVVAAFPKRSVMLAGSSVHFDRAWMRVHMPNIDEDLSHRHMDSSCIGTFLTMLGDPPLAKSEARHRASADVWNSIRTFYAASDMVFDWQEDSTDAAHLRRLLARGSA